MSSDATPEAEDVARAAFEWSRLTPRARLRRIRDLGAEPGTLLRSLQLSRRVGGSSMDFPVVAGPSARIRCHDSSRFELGGHLFLGYWPDKKGGRWNIPFASGPTVLAVGRQGKLKTGGWVVIGDGTRISVRGELAIGEGTLLNANVQMVVRSTVTIGPNCGISWDALIMDTDEHPVVVGGEVRDHTAPITIGEHVWIGTRATVLKGVTVGDGAIVAAQAVVTRDVPARAVVAGSPARVVRTDVDWW